MRVRRRSSLPPSPRCCQASTTVTAASATCGRSRLAHVARDPDALAGNGVERPDRLVVDVVDLGEERELVDRQLRARDQEARVDRFVGQLRPARDEQRLVLRPDRRARAPPSRRAEQHVLARCRAAPARARRPPRRPRPPPRCHGARAAPPRRAGGRSIRRPGSARQSSARPQRVGRHPLRTRRLDTDTPAARPSRWFAHARRHPGLVGGRTCGARAARRPAGRARPGRATLDGAPLNVFADGLGAIQVRVDGVAAGLFYDPTENPAHAGLEIKEGDRVYPLEDGFDDRARPRLGRDHADRPRRRHPAAALRVHRRAEPARGRGLHVHQRRLADRRPLRDHRTSPAPPTSIRVGALADLYVGNNDSGNGVIRSVAPRFVGGRDEASGLVYGLQEITPWTALQEGDFELVFDNFAGDGLNNTVDCGGARQRRRRRPGSSTTSRPARRARSTSAGCSPRRRRPGRSRRRPPTPTATA